MKRFILAYYTNIWTFATSQNTLISIPDFLIKPLVCNNNGGVLMHRQKLLILIPL